VTPARRVLGGALAIVAAVTTAALSRAPQRTQTGEAGLLRLSWSGRPDRVEVCRVVSDSELANLPRHMRQPTICEGRSAEYRLRVARDGETLVDEPVWGGGVRHDRPIYLYRELPIAPGRHRLVVTFTRLDTDSAVSPGRRSRIDQLPPILEFDSTVVVAPRGVVLVTFDPARGTLVVPAASPGAPAGEPAGVR